MSETRHAVFLLDGTNMGFRSYYQADTQDPKYNVRPSDGLPTGGVRLLNTQFLRIAREGAAGLRPSHVVVAFDKSSAESPRRQLYPEYKANRTSPPDGLKAQLPLFRDLARAYGFTPVESPGVEADDLIASYAREAVARGLDVLVMTADKDMMQLVGPNVRFYDFPSGKEGKPGYRPERNLDEAGVAEAWDGAPPHLVGDVLALMGDASDNVPGIPGIGKKTAAQLIIEHGDLETLLSKAGEIKQPKRRELLTTYADQARMSRRLVALDDRAALPVPLDDMAFSRPDPARVIGFLKALEINGGVKSAAKDLGVKADAIRPDPAFAAGGAVAQVFEAGRYRLLPDARSLAETVAAARAGGTLGLTVEADGDALVGLGLATGPNEAAYVAVAHRGEESLFGGGAVEGQAGPAAVRDVLGPLLSDASVTKVVHDLKAATFVLARNGINLRGAEDVMLASAALDSGRGGHGLDELCDRHLGGRPESLKEAMGAKGKLSLADVEPARAVPFVSRRADCVLRLWGLLSPRLDAEGAERVYRELELPMVNVLAGMEWHGIAVDIPALQGLSASFAATMASLEAEIHELAGERFDVSSPKQVGDILFGKMEMPGAKRTPSGQWATPATLLDELAAAGHPLPGRIVEWRQAAKLKSTYSDALQGAAREGQVKTTFSLAATVTGRLSSSEPNLQNIPIRTHEGRRIRRAFVARPGKVLVSADYSQIELRILAHVASIPQLVEAFERGQDVHAATASAMFGVPVEAVPAELRRRAKTINFGIIYGISAFGLAQRLGIPQGEAASFISSYFERFPGIRDYMEATKEAVRADASVRTLFGRTCHYPGIRSANGSERQAVERQAINAPIQGTAADIIRRAMIRMNGTLREAGMGEARMLLQVHDELVFEMPPEMAPEAIPVIMRVMEGAAAPDLNMAVPLVVEAKSGLNWEEAH